LYAWPGNRKPSGEIAVLAPLDDFGYVVSGFTADGYLRLDRASNPPSPIYDSFLIGHPVIIRNAWVPAYGIVAQPAMHVMTRELRDQISGAFSLDLVYVDIGARSEVEARKNGFAILDPVALFPEYVTLAGTKRAGPNLGRKALAAALTEVALTIESARKKTPATFVWAAQTRLSARGGGRGSLGMTRAANILSIPYVIVLDAVAAPADGKSPVLGKGPVLVLQKDEPSPLRTAIQTAAAKENISLQVAVVSQAPLLSPFPRNDGKDAVGLAIPVKFAGTPSEVVDLADLQALTKILTRLIVEGPWIEGGVK
jgi:putative aminopeptidase FrvX